MEPRPRIAARAARILPIRHFHLVFTLPAEARGLAQRHPAEVYGAFFHVVGELLEELGRTRLKAEPGWTAVLHTWTCSLAYHPHLHVLVTAGGLQVDGEGFREIQAAYLFPGEVMGRLLRGKMLGALRGLSARGASPELSPGAFGALMEALAKHRSWVVHAEPPFRDASHLLGYLGRYVHRIAISDARLVAVSEDRVVFRTRHGKVARLHPMEFLRRFVQHVLPTGFHKVRHGGLYVSRSKGTQARALLAMKAAEDRPPARAKQASGAIKQGPTCPICGAALERTRHRLPPRRQLVVEDAELRGPPGDRHA
nr:transposase [uncultured Holophaga sp.]